MIQKKNKKTENENSTQRNILLKKSIKSVYKKRANNS